ncbi:NAD(+) diphosphatase [Clostridium sp. DL1XJH146]
MKYKYCPICGNKLELINSWDEGMVPYCPIDKEIFFDLPKPCVVVAIIKEDKVLLMKQPYIYKNSKVLPSGYVSVGENIEETVVREVKEETNLDIHNIVYLGSDMVEKKELLMITFMADYLAGNIKKSDEVYWVGWCDIDSALDEMKEDNIGKKVMKKVIDRLK